ncbi:MAG: hypothetical protein R3C28_26035 [Pirellulaceae bacterium]
MTINKRKNWRSLRGHRVASGRKAFELLALSQFALKDFANASNTAHDAIRLGVVADWPTLYDYYQNRERYVQQFNALRDYVDSNPGSENGVFLLAYHNLMLGHYDDAQKRFAKVHELNPNDQIAQEQFNQLQQQHEVSRIPCPRLRSRKTNNKFDLGLN